MSIASSARIRNEMCTMRICVDDHSDGEIVGRLFNAYFNRPVFFDNWIQLIKAMEDFFNLFEYPHETMTRRSFEQYRDDYIDPEENPGMVKHKPIKPAIPKTLFKHNALGKLATFETKVMFRQNASWQGRVRWVEAEAIEEFGSTLELIFMIENSVDA
ncbi:MAG: hypothetical protein K6F11_06265 [Lachnospiraceae bacterium]|nr:hypothetical protein [Lachnospiraceae bacterium]